MTLHFSDFQLKQELTLALDKLNYKHPTEVQSEVIPIALNKRDLVVKSQTGSGKTAAFVIPICQLVEWEENKPQALILTPTRELAAQIKEEITNIGRFKRIKATAVYGKSSFEKQKHELKQKSHVVVGTPGRVLDHLEKGTLDVGKLTCLVLDEADEMLNMGFIDQVESIIQKLPQPRVSMFFSATLPDDIALLSEKYLNDPVTIDIKKTDVLREKITHTAIDVRDHEKDDVLKNITIVENPDSCIIFCGTQEQVNKVFNQLDDEGYPCDKIHGGMRQEDRFDVMADFKRGRFRYLVATDVAARGIDIDNISLVINYDLPNEKESYVHRTGRTGRAGRTGKAISFVTPSEHKDLEEIEQFIGTEIPKVIQPSQVEVSRKRESFEKKLEVRPKLIKDKSESLNEDIMKLYFNGGKKKKIRAIDFVGTITKIAGITSDDIGIITIQENVSYVDILNGKGPTVLKEMKNTTVKGKLLKVHKAKK
ncbi:DEAD/DEAH box helicase [Bacillus suaedae]|uniref:ATP-dependent RNA helicase DbpA n=1 Tax=Halalkalibacter suaedae TaxID=2822140 RepID=A0A940WR74_9BACI|nr:DEAD/DEAH box helicase [Bacillus suaedae]MBP3950836.1 DEAD/DEAH box helicase [Bacillus suaedae]